MTEQELCRQQYIPVNLLCTKVIFHEDSQDHSMTENQEEIEQNMPLVADHDHNVTGVTFVDDSQVAVVAVRGTTDLPVQEDEYDTDSESNREDDTSPDITVIRSGRAICTHFRLYLYKEHHQDDQV